MHQIKIFIFALACCFSFFCEAQEITDRVSSDLDEYELVWDRIYIQPEQLFISNEGIFLFIQGSQVLVHQLNCDGYGIYCRLEQLDKITEDRCYNKHPIWCRRCHGCVVRECPFHCKCVEWNKK